MAIQNQTSSLFPFAQPQYQLEQSPFDSMMMPFAFNQPAPVMAPQVPQNVPTSADPMSVLMQAVAARLASSEQRRGGTGQPGRHLGVGGAEITAADPTGSGISGFFSTPEQVQANLDSGRTINSLSPQLMQYNQANRAGVPQSQVVPTAQPSALGGLTMEGPYGVGSSQLVPPQNPLQALFAQQQLTQQRQTPVRSSVSQMYPYGR